MSTQIGALVAAWVRPTLAAQGWLSNAVYTAVGPVEVDPTGDDTYTTTATTLSVVRLFRFNHRMIDGNRIKDGDRQAWILKSDIPMAPTMNDFITIDGQRWVIQSIDGMLDETAWKFHLRRAAGSAVNG